jgi:hypothetical protein
MTSRYAPLDPEPPRQEEKTPTMPKTQPPSHAVSPTDSLYEAELKEYSIRGNIYTDYKEGMRQEGAKLQIPEEYVSFFIDSIEGISLKQGSFYYNALGKKLYEHKHLWEEGISYHDKLLGDTSTTLGTYGNQIDKLTLETEQLQRDNAQLDLNMRSLHRQNKDLSARVALLESYLSGPTAFTATAPPHNTYAPQAPHFNPPSGPPPTGPSGPSFAPPPPPPPGPSFSMFIPNPAPVPHFAPPPPVPSGIKIPPPPKFKGKSDLPLESWLQQFGIWASYSQLQSDQLIAAALMHLKGGPFQFMTDYADRAARNLPLGTWAAFETYKAGQRCQNPKYKGYYIIPKRETARTVEEGSSTPTPAPATSIAAPVASAPTVTSAGKAKLRTFLEFFEAYKTNGGANPSAHIEAVEEDFMPSL